MDSSLASLPPDSLQRSNPHLPAFRPGSLHQRPSTTSLVSSASFDFDSEPFPPLSATSTSTSAAKSPTVSKLPLPAAALRSSQNAVPLSKTHPPASTDASRPKTQPQTRLPDGPDKARDPRKDHQTAPLDTQKSSLVGESAPSPPIGHAASPTRTHLIRDSHMSVIDSKDEHDVADVVNYLISYQSGVDKSRRNHSQNLLLRKACYTPVSTSTTKSDFDQPQSTYEHRSKATSYHLPPPPIASTADAELPRSHHNHGNHAAMLSPLPAKARDSDKPIAPEQFQKDSQTSPRNHSRNQSRSRAKRNTESRQSTRSASPARLATPSSRSPSRDGKTPVHQKYTLACIRAASPIMAGSSSPNRPFVAQWSSLVGARRHVDPLELDPIKFMVNSSHLYMQKQGMSMLHTLSVDEENHSKVIDLEIIPSVLQLVSSPDADIQKDASNALAYLSRNDEVLVEIAESNGISVLIQLLASFELRVRTHVLTGLKTLAQREAYADRIIEDGGLDPIIKIIKGKFVELRRIAAETLSILCGYRQTSFKIVERGLMSELANIIRSKDAFVRIDGVRALARLLHQAPTKFIPIAMEKDLHSVCMENLQVCSKEGNSDDLYVASLQAIFEFSCDDKATTLFLKNRIYEILVDGTHNRNMDVLRESIRVFSAITSQESFNVILVQDSKTLCSLINLGYSNNILIKKSIAKIFRRLVNANHQNVLHQLNATTCLFNFARFQDHDIMIDVSLALGGILQLEFIPVEERTLEFQKMVRLGLIETLSVLCEIEHRESRCTLSSIISRLCDYVQDFDKSAPLLLHSITKLFATPEIFIVSNLTHSIYVLSQNGTYNRIMADAGLLGYLKKYSMTRNLDLNVIDEGSKAIETLSKEILELKGVSHERDRTKSHSAYSKRA